MNNDILFQKFEKVQLQPKRFNDIQGGLVLKIDTDTGVFLFNCDTLELTDILGRPTNGSGAGSVKSTGEK